MTHFNPACHTAFTHLFHPFCPNLSNFEFLGYLGVSSLFTLASGGISHFLHHYYYHNHTTLNPERVTLLSNDKEETLEDLVDNCRLVLAADNTVNLNVPTEKDIMSLIIQCDNVHKELQNQLSQMGIIQNPWADDSILKKFDKCIKLAFLIGISIFKNLDGYIESKKMKMTRVEVLSKQNNFRYRYSLLMAYFYHFARGTFTYLPREKTFLYTFLKEYHQKNKTFFYEEGTLQANWRKLYNCYCKVLYTYIDKNELQESDDRFIKWTKGDYHPCSFSGHPGTRPS